MIRNPRDKSPSTKEEETQSLPEEGSSRSAWLRDSRVVRGARANGGKDRHSKVTTARGLRDRRVRLSVPTAIQLYDLQDRLGLNQPSKAVDWLLQAAQLEIDKLPPLQFPPESSIHHQNPSLPPQEDPQNPYSAFYFMEPSLQNNVSSNIASQEAPQGSFYRQEGLPPPLSLSQGSQLLLSMFSSDYDPRNASGGFQMGSSSSHGDSKHRHF